MKHVLNVIMNDGQRCTCVHSHRVLKPDPALYLVATPIGNLSDITLRALEILAGIDILASEDTRITRVLLEHYAIRRKPIIYNEHNAREARFRLLDMLRAGSSVALVSDAGTPLISDPGFKLVKEARKADIRVIPIPGPSAVIAALITTGLPTDNFFFCGFLSVKPGTRRKRLKALKTIDATLVFYESPHRLIRTLTDMIEVFGENRPAALCRELTKTFETINTSTLATLFALYTREENHPRGEIVLVVGPVENHSTVFSEEETDGALLDFMRNMSSSKAANTVAQMTGRRKQVLYTRILELKEKRHAQHLAMLPHRFQ